VVLFNTYLPDTLPHCIGYEVLKTNTILIDHGYIGLTTKTAIDQLPSLPQVLVQILDAIHGDNADFQHIADIIRQDMAMASKLLTVSNSSYYGREQSCESVERALLFLGTDVVKTIVITASIKQFYSQFSQNHQLFLQKFWRRSLVTANLAQVLATLTSYSSPDEAYLCGLLTDVGQLLLLTHNETEYLKILEEAEDDQQLLLAEKQHLSFDHCQQGADLVESWQLSNFMADAVRYHHESSDLILDAHQLVKIINLSSSLGAEGDITDEALAAADNLFGLNESLTRELRSRIDNDVNSMASSLGINIDYQKQNESKHLEAHRQLGERLSELGELSQINAGLSQSITNEGLQSAAQRSIFLTLGISNSVLFLLDEKQQELCSQEQHNPSSPQGGKPLNLTIPLQSGRSLISDAFINAQHRNSNDQQQVLSIVDRQLVNYCQSDILVCWPLVTQSNAQVPSQKVGVLVFACNEQQLKEFSLRSRLINRLCSQIATAIINNEQHLKTLDKSGPNNEQYLQKIQEAVHEASNPLSIIRNYLELLTVQLGDDHSANDGLELIKEEIDRVGNILLRLKDPDQTTTDKEINVNSVIRSTARIFEDSLFATKQINLALDLDKSLKSIPGDPEHLKQILTNLLKNAVEALPQDGNIRIGSEATVSFSGRDFAAIYIEDNGPGISDTIKQNLFSPVTSTKDSNHSGLGLSITKKLIDDLKGSIICRSSANSGTQFQILLPK
jgi:HD-like signal output (HDOD) protein/nitrogen-specific signal transduction histidine kinase